MKKLLLLVLCAAGMAVAGTKTYAISLYGPAMLGTTLLSAGDYQVVVTDQKAVIRNGKKHCEAPVKIETGDDKYTTTAVRFDNGDGKMHIQEIHIGGSKTKLVFTE